ncbi:MAG TPA: hypothetical protein VGG72_02290 [Bryobacteraceae bacterium]|jgi:hypothetical protein
MILKTLSAQGIVAIKRSQTRNNLCLLRRQPYSSFGPIKSEPIAIGNVPPAFRRITKVHAS